MRSASRILIAVALLVSLPGAGAFSQGMGGEPVAPDTGPAPQMAPVVPGQVEPQVRMPNVDSGSDPLMQVPDTYVAEPQMNIAPRGEAQVDNDYPTVAIADYVFGCMASNGQTRAAMNACACSIDVIASILPYEEYIDAETTLGVRQVGGEKSEIFRTQGLTENLLDLRRAQAEAEMRCF